MTATDTQPFRGAATVYRRAYKVLNHMGESGHVTVLKRGGHAVGATVSNEMTDVIKALNEGDEVFLKSFLLDSRFFNIAQET